MKVHNQTNIDDSIIQSIMREARVNANGTIERLVIRYNERLGAKGHCKKRGKLCIVELRDNYNIPTLAHELRHVSQYTWGLGPIMELERETMKYVDRVHEIDAREFASRYK